jgi:hypothetical protein
MTITSIPDTDLSCQLEVTELAELEEERVLTRLYEMRTSISPRYSVADQARELHVSPATIKRWAKSERFQQLATRLAPAARAPMIDAAREHIIETLLPASLEAAAKLLADPRASATAKVTLISQVWRSCFEVLKGDSTQDAMRRDLMEFLKEQGQQINIQLILNNSTVNVPAAYTEVLRRALPPDVVEGEISSG